MAEYLPLEIPEDGKLAQNIIWFARALGKAGVPIGPGRLIDAIRAVEVAGFSSKQDFYWVLHACFVSRPEHRQTFAQVFRLFWRDPRYLEQMMGLMLPSVRGTQPERQAEAAEKRAAQALLDGADRPAPETQRAEDDDTEIEIEASLSMSQQERLRDLDFEQMSTEELAQARAEIAKLRLPVRPLISRRQVRAPRGNTVDRRALMRHSLRQGGQFTTLPHRAPGHRWPNLVALCDISGSMAGYSRMVLQFLHAISNRQGQGWAQVHAFTFGTRLTNITRHLRQRDVDAALARSGTQAQDWQGGTRIGACLHQFNCDWSRRVLGQGAVVLLITDGLEREAPEDLGRAAERLHLSARQVIWLNPLLRFDGFAPRAQGIAALMPHVDSFRPAHNLTAFRDLCAALADPDDRGVKAQMMAALRR